jgi:dethiobiotin synthetase
MARSYFITGTDTDVGKTHITCALIRGLQQQGQKVVALKPIVSGIDAQGQYPDLQSLTQACAVTIAEKYQACYRFEPAIAPHLAAARVGESITFAALNAWWHEVQRAHADADVFVLEGAGGWLLPLGQGRTLADWVIQQQLQVLCVVGMRLGCLNHALLTTDTLMAQGAMCTGWVANQMMPEWPEYAENVATLKEYLALPYQGEVRYGQDLFRLEASTLSSASEV